MPISSSLLTSYFSGRVLSCSFISHPLPCCYDLPYQVCRTILSILEETMLAFPSAVCEYASFKTAPRSSTLRDTIECKTRDQEKNSESHFNNLLFFMARLVERNRWGVSWSVKAHCDSNVTGAFDFSGNEVIWCRCHSSLHSACPAERWRWGQREG